MANERPTVKSTTAVRQGVTGHNVRYVLFWGTLFAVIAMTLFTFFSFINRAAG